MRPSRKFSQASLLAFGSLVLLSGCAQKANPDPKEDHKKSTEKRAPVRDSSQPFQLPIDEFGMNPDDYYLIEKARKILIDNCMENLGSVYSVPLPEKPIFQASRRYGVTDIKTAGIYGYHMPKASSGLGEDPGKLSAKERMLLFGEGGQRQSSKVESAEIPSGGCSGEAESIIANNERPESAIAVAQRINSESFSTSLNDPRFIKANEEWSACMKKDGYEYDSPLTAISDPRFQEAREPTEEEKRVAVMDVKCKHNTKLLIIWSKIEREEQDVMIRKNSKTLQTLRDFQEKEIRNARQVLSDSH